MSKTTYGIKSVQYSTFYVYHLLLSDIATNLDRVLSINRLKTFGICNMDVNMKDSVTWECERYDNLDFGDF